MLDLFFLTKLKKFDDFIKKLPIIRPKNKEKITIIHIGKFITFPKGHKKISVFEVFDAVKIPIKITTGRKKIADNNFLSFFIFKKFI